MCLLYFHIIPHYSVFDTRDVGLFPPPSHPLLPQLGSHDSNLELEQIPQVGAQFHKTVPPLTSDANGVDRAPGYLQILLNLTANWSPLPPPWVPSLVRTAHRT